MRSRARSRARAWLAARLGLVLLAARAAPLAALQVGGSLDLGTGPARWDQVESEGARAQGTLGAFYRPARVLGLQPELTGGLGLSTEEAVRTALRWDVTGRLHTPGAVTGAWLGVGLGGIGTGTRTASLTRLEGGVRSGIGPAGFRVWLARTSFGIQPGVGRTGLENDPFGDSTVTGSKQVVEYTDLGTRAGLDLGRYEVGATIVRRWGSAALQRPALRSIAWEVSAVWWLRPSVGLVASAGHSLPELSLALPGARYRSLGVRLALGAPSRGSRVREAPAPVAAAAAVNGRLVLATPSRLAIVGPPAGRAEVMGDFTDWQARPLVRIAEGRWALEGALSRGVHQLNVRFDDGEWMVPAGTVAVDDGFGGKAGLFVVR
jgi:hypothetical protein